MSRFLFAWELGANFGHVGQFLPVAERLRDAGHEALFVVRDVTQADQFLRRRGFTCLQAPHVMPSPRSSGAEPESYADILSHCGWDTGANLSALTLAWSALYRWTEPDVIVGSHAPTALFAARGKKLRRAALGTGFECPPRQSPMPSMRPWKNVPLSRLLAAELSVLVSVNAVLEELDMSKVNKLNEIFDYDAGLLCTLPALDHYPGRQNAEYLGPLYADFSDGPVEWPPQEGRRVFVYLRSQFEGLEDLLSALQSLRTSTLIFAPGIGDELIKRYSSPLMSFRRKPASVPEVAKDCDLAICHGGHGTVAAFLQTGVPLLMLPTHLEQYLSARNVAQFGAGIVAPKNSGESDYKKMLSALLDRLDYKVRAVDFMKLFGSSNPGATIETVVSRLEMLTKACSR